jgi:hypothetical protein
MVTSSSPSNSGLSAELLLCKFSRKFWDVELNDVEIEREAKLFFAWCAIKGHDNCYFPEYLVGFVKGTWCPFLGWQK